jgi:peptidoglycan-associated lipoprotein
MRQIVIVMVLASLLVGCGNKSVKPSEAVATPTTATPSVENSTISQSANTAPTTHVPEVAYSPFTDPNNILSQRTIYFDYDQYNIKEMYKPLIQAHAKYLSEHPTATIIVTGNADERGSREYNLALGQKRAASTKQMLNLLGVSDQQIETVSYGEEYPVEAGHDEMAWSKNRRAEIDYTNQ